MVTVGLKVIGGVSEDEDDDIDFGIFVKSVLPGGVADLDGKDSIVLQFTRRCWVKSYPNYID